MKNEGKIFEDTLKELEKKIFYYMDIPYFSNHPNYISLWQKYYKITKNPQVLLLMFHKKIAALHHWLYVELSNLFIKSNNPEMARFIILLALDNNVYNKKILKKQLLTINEVERKFTDNQLYSALKKKKISCFGKTWNDNIELENEIFSLEENQNTSIDISENLKSSSEILERNIESVTLIEDKSAGVFVGLKIKVDEFYFIVKQILENSKFLTVKISDDPQYNCDSLLSFEYCFTSIDQNNVTAISLLYPKCGFYKYQNIHYVIFPYDKYMNISAIFKRDNFSISSYRYFYLSQIIKINLKTLKVKKLVRGLKGYFINEQFEVKLEAFDLVEWNDDNLLEFKMNLSLHFAKIDFSLSLIEILEFVKGKLFEIDCQKSIDEHKMDLLRNNK